MSTAVRELKQSSISEMPSVVSGRDRNALIENFRTLVSKRAHELFEEFGHVYGNDVEHWLQAEGELCARLPEVQQSGSWFTVSAPLAGIPPSQIRVSVDDSGALISAGQTQDRTDSSTQQDISFVFYAVQGPESVSPETASAYVKNGTLTAVARKAGSDEPVSTLPVTAEKPRVASRRGKR